jgi:two-component system chemotaxis response regulator CheY
MTLDKSKRVMVVEDTKKVRELLSLILKNEGFDVIESVNGLDAWNKLNGSDIDVLITDLNMPEMNGFELVKKLRSSAAFHLTPVLMVTSENHEPIRIKAKQLGVNEWLMKPLIPSELLDVVRRLTTV